MGSGVSVLIKAVWVMNPTWITMHKGGGLGLTVVNNVYLIHGRFFISCFSFLFASGDDFDVCPHISISVQGECTYDYDHFLGVNICRRLITK